MDWIGRSTTVEDAGLIPEKLGGLAGWISKTDPTTLYLFLIALMLMGVAMLFWPERKEPRQVAGAIPLPSGPKLAIDCAMGTAFRVHLTERTIVVPPRHPEPGTYTLEIVHADGAPHDIQLDPALALMPAISKPPLSGEFGDMVVLEIAVVRGANGFIYPTRLLYSEADQRYARQRK